LKWEFTYFLGGYPIKDSPLARGSLALDRVRSTQSQPFATSLLADSAKQWLLHAPIDYKRRRPAERIREDGRVRHGNRVGQRLPRAPVDHEEQEVNGPLSNALARESIAWLIGMYDL